MSYREFLNKLLIGGGSGSGGASSWDEITGKPSAFPPSAHTHAQADVTGLPDIAAKAHTHANKTTLDKFGETNGKPTYDGAEIGGGGTVDESRLLPALDSVPIDRNGNPLIYRYESGIDADTLCLLHLDDATWADATGKNTVTQKGSVAKVSPGYFDNALDLTASLSSGNLSWLQIPWVEDYAVDVWTMEFFAKPTKSLVNFTFLTFGTNGFMLNSEHLSNIRMDSYSADYAFTLGDWYWFVLQCDGTATKLYINNELVLQANFVPDIEGKTLQLGSHYEVNNQDNTFVGLIDEFRWSNGIRYPGGVMTIPTQPFGTPTKSYEVSDTAPTAVDESRLLPNVSGLTQADDGKVMQFKFTSAEAEIPVCCNCQALMPDTTNQLVNDSGIGTTLTLGSRTSLTNAVAGPFGGNCVAGITSSAGDEYGISIKPQIVFGVSEDFTLEWWVRPFESTVNGDFIQFNKNGRFSTSWRMRDGSVYQGNDGTVIPAGSISSLAVNVNVWNHLALCRKNGTIRLFINGVKVGEASYNWAPPADIDEWVIYGGLTNTNHLGGFRYSRSALYEADFEVPTAQFAINAGKEMVLDFMREATSSKAGAMSAADKAKLDKFDLSNLAVDDLLIGTATGLARITLADLKAKLDMLATGGNTGN